MAVTEERAASESAERRQPRSTVYVYDFAEGRAEMADLLGGEGANLAKMTRLGLRLGLLPPVGPDVRTHRLPRTRPPLRGSDRRGEVSRRGRSLGPGLRSRRLVEQEDVGRALFGRFAWSAAGAGGFVAHAAFPRAATDRIRLRNSPPTSCGACSAL